MYQEGNLIGIYKDLAAALDRLPNGYPATPSGVEIEILKRIFTLEEAFLASYLGRDWEGVKLISEKTGLDRSVTRDSLKKMAEHGLVWSFRIGGELKFRLAPFIVGIYEAQHLDEELAHLVEEYLTHGGAKGIMAPQPAIHRVVPAQKSVKSEWILPYDDVRSILLEMKSFHVTDCICRQEQRLIGHGCEFPERMCLSYSERENPTDPDGISQQEALAILERSEEIGLVHTVSNVASGFGYVCNCCGCCCGILRGINEWGIENSVAQANFYAVIEPELCSGCGTCIERCQVKAISDQNGISVVDRQRCIGCGLCVTGCPNGVARLERKPEAEIVHPPEDFPTWERERLEFRAHLPHNQGMTR
jgi:Na+-translocating ferredoxin:NAD+ oxidoreductase subunit B